MQSRAIPEPPQSAGTATTDPGPVPAVETNKKPADSCNGKQGNAGRWAVQDSNSSQKSGKNSDSASGATTFVTTAIPSGRVSATGTVDENALVEALVRLKPAERERVLELVRLAVERDQKPK